MKFLVLSLMIVSGFASARTEVAGTSSLNIMSDDTQQASLVISGAPAEILWKKMDVKIFKASQFNPTGAFKQGKNIRCFDYTPNNKGYACYINVEDLSSAAVGEFQ
jgi:hypothetical protein